MKILYQASAALVLPLCTALSPLTAQENDPLPPALVEAWQNVLSSQPTPDSGSSLFYWEQPADPQAPPADSPRPAALLPTDADSLQKLLTTLPASALDVTLWLLGGASADPPDPAVAETLLRLFARQWATQEARHIIAAIGGQRAEQAPLPQEPALFSNLSGVQNSKLLQPPAVIEPVILAPR